MEKMGIVGESAEQRETIEGHRSKQEIKKELDDIGYAIKKEIQSYKKREKQIDLLETYDRAKRTPKANLFIKHLNSMIKLHEQQALLSNKYLKYRLIK